MSQLFLSVKIDLYEGCSGSASPSVLCLLLMSEHRLPWKEWLFSISKEFFLIFCLWRREREREMREANPSPCLRDFRVIIFYDVVCDLTATECWKKKWNCHQSALLKSTMVKKWFRRFQTDLFCFDNDPP